LFAHGDCNTTQLLEPTTRLLNIFHLFGHDKRE
jgi:hypothetical protein